MVDRIRKNLRQLLPKQHKQLTEAIKRIKQNDLVGFDLKKLAGRDDVYRVRIGSFRVIFRKLPETENAILAVERRTDITYN